MPSVDIIILNWNGFTDTLKCLQSLRKLNYPTYRVMVVDNASTDGSTGFIRDQFPEVTLMENYENLGFTGGNNIGMRLALENGSDYVLLLNNDTEVDPDFLRVLVEAAESDSRIGIAGPIIYYFDHPQIIWSAGGAINRRRGQTRMVGLNEIDQGQFGQKPREVDFVSGCALLIKRVVLKQVGLLDERFFAYYEEVEWCVRITMAEFMIVHVPQARIWHKISLDKRDDSPLVHYYMTRNRLLLLKITGAGLKAWLHTIIVDYLRTLLSWSLQPKWRGKKHQRKMMLLAIIDAGLGRWGYKKIAT